MEIALECWWAWSGYFKQYQITMWCVTCGVYRREVIVTLVWEVPDQKREWNGKWWLNQTEGIMVGCIMKVTCEKSVWNLSVYVYQGLGPNKSCSSIRNAGNGIRDFWYWRRGRCDHWSGRTGIVLSEHHPMFVSISSSRKILDGSWIQQLQQSGNDLVVGELWCFEAGLIDVDVVIVDL